MLHAYAAIWKIKEPLDHPRVPTKYGDQMLRLLEAVHLPVEVAVSHCREDWKTEYRIGSREPGKAAAKRAALQNSDLIGVSTIVLPILTRTP